MADICKKCKVSPVNATGVLCDACMMANGGGVVVDAPPQEAPIVAPAQSLTATDVDNDKFDSFTKTFENGIHISIIINYTKNFSEINTYKDDVLMDTSTYVKKELFEKELSALIKKIEDAEKEEKKLEAERIKYFESIKSMVGEFGFDKKE